jgi:two-component system response regulator GlrR
MRHTEDERTASLAGNPPPVQPRRPLGVLVRSVDVEMLPSVYRFSEGKCLIGSGKSCNIVMRERTVSREHAELSLVPEGVRVRDLESRNGTFYMGQRVESLIVAPGTRLRLGKAEIRIDADVELLASEVASSTHAGETYRGMVGRSPAMQQVFAMLERLEGTLVTVLVTGESGVGKELVARALHEGSAVASGPLVVVNCGALPRELVASELFGHKRGAFTGAVDARQGAFATADGGTLFLDEIGELPLEVQPMLLRALETGEVRAVGTDRASRVRTRIVAATHRDLAEDTRSSKFREDLYYRLAVVRVAVPPLRDRVEDIEPLARAFARSVGLDDLPPPVIAQLKARAWPGNVRELRNAVSTYAALGVIPETASVRGSLLDVALGEHVDVARPYADQKDALIDRFTERYLRALLAHTAGNQTAAARLAGLDRGYLGRLLARYGLLTRG